MLTRSKMILIQRSAQARNRLSRFGRDEDGSLIIFGVYILVIILMVGGIGIDLMRYERDRAELQYTLDRAVLAAADLDQTLSPNAVVADYFDKAGLSQYLTNVTVDQGLGYRVVSGTATADIQTQFMRMSGLDTLTANAASTAEERIDGIEISLVLDVSGSMNSNSKLTNLKTAARDFIDQMVDNTQDGKLSISIIPYATQVAMPANFINEFNISQEHTYSNCINFQSSDFNTTAVSLVDPMQRTMHFDPWYASDGRDNNPIDEVTLPVCESKASREMMILQKDRVALKDFITNLTAAGNTSIDVGMKWGSALLDPSLQPVVDSLIVSGDVDPVFDALPQTYDSGNTLKVIVLMTDGQNTSQYYINDGYREGESNVWWNDIENRYSVYVGLDDYDEDNDGITEEPLFWWPTDRSWNDHAYGEGTYDTTVKERVCRSYKKNGSCKKYKTVKTTVTVDEPGSAVVVSYPDLWAYTSLQWNAYYNYAGWMGTNAAYGDWYYDVRNYVPSSTKNARTKSICDAAKDNQVIVFTIGFEAPSSGKAVLKDCASSDSHFFDVNGLAINDAFASIASSIRKLRLTQ
jgi:Flp pilus assembly protein TadG